ncbi:hypothetical protein ACH42_04060 [Endozoicomonas sp. (ex Bugula neritina AB1)]|nr:hypothetical protein ACH42_04060 [Endozoicomonas sp. (ex Bugula neritina AB1)]
MEASKNRKISTSALARSLELPVKEMFRKLEQAGWIERDNDNWALTTKGQTEGGEYTTHVKYGTYIVWPEQIASLSTEVKERPADESLHNGALTATQIGERNHLSGRQINRMFAELGWIKRAGKNWMVTALGERVGGRAQENHHNQQTYVCWPEQVLHNPNVISSLKDVKADLSHAIGLDDQAGNEMGVYREKFPAKLRAADGHILRSKTELVIDNWLYMAGIVHAYERRLPIDLDAYAEFYLPSGNVYLEYMGQDSDTDYRQRKDVKINLYKSHDLNVIALTEEQVRNIDVHLPRLLSEHGIRLY